MFYNEPVFRPPAEANSLILQTTYGCSWNKCRFCEMYSSKKFTVKDLETIVKDLDYLAGYQSAKRLFIGDGDIFSMHPNQIQNVLRQIKYKLPHIKSISAYGSARTLQKVNQADLITIRDLGLSLLYVGVESGDDDTLKLVNKGIRSDIQLQALLKAKEAGFKLSVMILNGIGGKDLSEQHALNSALFINQLKPELLSFLTVSFPFGFYHFKRKLDVDFTPLSSFDLAKECFNMISNFELEQTIFRSDHISNLMPLKGRLNKDKNRLLQELKELMGYLANNDSLYINESHIL